MSTFIKRALVGAAVAGSMTLLGATSAIAAETDGDNAVGSGSQIVAPLSLPTTIDGNAISILGNSASSGSSTPAVTGSASADATTTGAGGTASATQALLGITIPVTIDGLSLAVLGTSSAQSSATAPAAPTTPTITSSGVDGVLSGTQAALDVNVPVTVRGNAISVLGTSSSTSSSATPARGANGNAMTSGHGAVAGGSQVSAPVAVPVTVGGNALSVLGTSTTQGDAATAIPGPSGHLLTGGSTGLLAGTQLGLPLTVPITLGGNAIALLGDSTVGTAVDPGTDPGTNPGTNPGTSPGTTPGGNGTVVGTPAGTVTDAGGLAVTGGPVPLGLGALALALTVAGGGLLLRHRATV